MPLLEKVIDPGPSCGLIKNQIELPFAHYFKNVSRNNGMVSSVPESPSRPGLPLPRPDLPPRLVGKDCVYPGLTQVRTGRKSFVLLFILIAFWHFCVYFVFLAGS